MTLITTEQGWFRWAGQYVKRQPVSRSSITITPGAEAAIARDVIIRGIKAAGSGGRLIFSVGHGKSLDGSPGDGLYELFPGRKFYPVGKNILPANPAKDAVIINVFHDVSAHPNQPSDLMHDKTNNPGSQRLKNWALYPEIGAVMRRVLP